MYGTWNGSLCDVVLLIVDVGDTGRREQTISPSVCPSVVQTRLRSAPQISISEIRPRFVVRWHFASPVAAYFFQIQNQSTTALARSLGHGVTIHDSRTRHSFLSTGKVSSPESPIGSSLRGSNCLAEGAPPKPKPKPFHFPPIPIPLQFQVNNKDKVSRFPLRYSVPYLARDRFRCCMVRWGVLLRRSSNNQGPNGRIRSSLSSIPSTTTTTTTLERRRRIAASTTNRNFYWNSCSTGSLGNPRAAATVEIRSATSLSSSSWMSSGVVSPFSSFASIILSSVGRTTRPLFLPSSLMRCPLTTTTTITTATRMMTNNTTGSRRFGHPRQCRSIHSTGMVGKDNGYSNTRNNNTNNNYGSNYNSYDDKNNNKSYKNNNNRTESTAPSFSSSYSSSPRRQQQQRPSSRVHSNRRPQRHSNGMSSSFSPPGVSSSSSSRPYGPRRHQQHQQSSVPQSASAISRGGSPAAFRAPNAKHRVLRARFVAGRTPNAAAAAAADRGQNNRGNSSAPPRDKQRWKDVEGSRYQRRQQQQNEYQNQTSPTTTTMPVPDNSYGRIRYPRRDGGIRLSSQRRDDEENSFEKRNPSNTTNFRSRSVGGYRNNGKPRRSHNPQEQEPASFIPLNTKRQKQLPSDAPKQEHQPSWFPPDKIEAYVACHPGLESVLCQELQSLGLGHRKKGFGAKLTSPSVQDLLRCHLYLGAASHVFLHCGEPFGARGLGELERKVANMPWSKILMTTPAGAVPRFHFKVSSSKSRLLHSTAIRDHVLVGIYKSLGYPDPEMEKNANNNQQRTVGDSVGNDNNEHDEDEDSDNAIRLTVQFYRDKAQISIDTSMTPIHRRSYRLETAKAPLREDLAFAFLYGAGWKPTYRSSTHIPVEATPKQKASTYTSFVDPFCGSGTIAIEAAAMAHGLPPGRLRAAPLKGTALYNPQEWKNLVETAMEASKSNVDASLKQIRASDRDKGAVQATRSNAERAGVLNLVETEHCAFTAHPWLEQPPNINGKLLIGSNLPFGRRLSAGVSSKNYLKHPLLPLYQSLANRLKSLQAAHSSFGALLLTDDRELLRLGGFQYPFRTTLSTKHGGIAVCGMFMDATSEDDSDPISSKRDAGNVLQHSDSTIPDFADVS